MSDDSGDNVLKVSVGGALLPCHTPEHAAILEPVGGILIDRSTDGYTLDEIERMAATLSQYARPIEIAAFNKLLEARRTAEARS